MFWTGQLVMPKVFFIIYNRSPLFKHGKETLLWCLDKNTSMYSFIWWNMHRSNILDKLGRILTDLYLSLEYLSLFLKTSVILACFSHGCSNHLNLEMEATFLMKNLPYLNLNISRTKNGTQALAWCAGDSLHLCCHPCESRKRRLRQVMKSLPEGKAVWANIARAKF